MKRFTAVLLSLTFVFAFVGCKGETAEESNPIPVENSTIAPEVLATYAGEGFKTIMAGLVRTNLDIVETIYVCGHLPVSSEGLIEKDGHKYYPVDTKRFSSYFEFSSLIYSAYADDKARSILTDKGEYADVDGVLCYDMNYAPAEPDFTFNYSDMEISISEKSEESCSFKVSLKKTMKKTGKEKSYSFDCTAVYINGRWRLADIYY